LPDIQCRLFNEKEGQPRSGGLNLGQPFKVGVTRKNTSASR
jgi:hypothetical protein